MELEVRAEPVARPVHLRVHPALCEGWGNCHRWGPHVYPLDEDGHLDLHRAEVPAELADEARRGAWACPNQAITVIDPRSQITSADPAGPRPTPERTTP